MLLKRTTNYQVPHTILAFLFHMRHPSTALLLLPSGRQTAVCSYLLSHLNLVIVSLLGPFHPLQSTLAVAKNFSRGCGASRLPHFANGAPPASPQASRLAHLLCEPYTRPESQRLTQVPCIQGTPSPPPPTVNTDWMGLSRLLPWRRMKWKGVVQPVAPGHQTKAIWGRLR